MTVNHRINRRAATARVLLICMAWLGGSAPVALAAEALSPARWERDIQAFEAADKTNPPPKDAILFLGSSTIRLWNTLETDFANCRVIRRGFGGCGIADCTAYVERIVFPYRPRMIVFYAGDNDLANGLSPGRVLKDFQEFSKKARQKLPHCKIAFIAIKPSKARWHLLPSIREANQKIRRWTRGQRRLQYIDTFTPMLRSDGTMREEWLQKDGLHLNPLGYARWTLIIRPYLPGNRAGVGRAGQD